MYSSLEFRVYADTCHVTPEPPLKPSQEASKPKLPTLPLRVMEDNVTVAAPVRLEEDIVTLPAPVAVEDDSVTVAAPVAVQDDTVTLPAPAVGSGAVTLPATADDHTVTK